MDTFQSSSNTMYDGLFCIAEGLTVSHMMICNAFLYLVWRCGCADGV
jgi:hypothetical protein